MNLTVTLLHSSNLDTRSLFSLTLWHSCVAVTRSSLALTLWHSFALVTRYISPTGSGYGLLHQAAWWAHREAAAELLRLGASPQTKSKDGTPLDIATQRAREKKDSPKRREFEEFMRWAVEGEECCIPAHMETMHGYPLALTMLPSSARGGHDVVCERDLVVAYGGAVTGIGIPAGTPHRADGIGRPYVGWHGSLKEGVGMM